MQQSPLSRTFLRIVLTGLALISTRGPLAAQEEGKDYPLGPIGGNYRVTPNSSSARISSLTSGNPGALAGLQVGDCIYGAFGRIFTPTGSYHYGVSQELGFAVDRAEAGDGVLPLLVLRPGTGGMTINVNLAPAGGLGPAYPRNSPKYAAMYETAVADLHTRAMNSNGSMGYFTGWTGLALLGHPNWNDTTGAKPYRLSINKIRDFIINELYNTNYAPNEDRLLDGTPNPNHAGGASNWQLGQKIMFLAEYWAKTADPNPVPITVGGVSSTVTVNQALQRGAEMCGNSIQWWKQPALAGNGFSPEYDRVAGMCSHGGVTGDYMHQGWYCGINITGCYSFNGMAFSRRAGMNMNIRPRDGHYFGYNLQEGDPIPAAIANALPASITLPKYGADPVRGSTITNPFWYDMSIHQKFVMQLNFLARRSAWYSAGSNDDGMVGYAPEAVSAYDAGGRTPGTLLGMAMYQQDVGGLDAADLARMESLKGYITRNYMRHQDAHAYCVGAQCYQAMCAPYLSDRQQRYFMDNWRFFFALSRTSTNGIRYFPSRSVADNYLDTNHCASINIALPYAIANGRYSLIPAYNTNRIIADFKSPAITWPQLAARYAKVTSASQPFTVDVCDGNGNVLAPGSYSASWSHVSGPGTATFSDATAASTTVNFPKSGRYRIQLTATSGSLSVTEPIDIDAVIVTAPAGYTQGYANYQVYTGISGNNVSNLTGAAKYPASPDRAGTLTSLEGSFSGDAYGQRIRGFIIPPATGQYRFYLSSDDASQFIFNGVGPAETTSVAINLAGAVSKYTWTAQSALFSLTAGQPYFFEVLHKEGSGADHVAVAWTNDQGISTPTIIPGDSLAVSSTASIARQPQPQTTVPGGSATFDVMVSGVGPFLYQWRLDGVPYWGQSSTSTLSLTNVSASAVGSYDCLITTPGGTLVSSAATLSLDATTVRTRGGLKREVWIGLAGSAITDLTGNANFPLFPTSTGVVTAAESGEAYGDNYGQKLSGWIKPPVSGAYRFFVSSDDASELWLSTDDSADNKARIAQVTGYSAFRAYSGGGQSAWINLTAGQKYYLEILHKEGGGGDHVSVTWQMPGETVPANGSAPIDGVYLEYDQYLPLLSDHWKLDETSGTTALNTVRTLNGSHLNGTLVDQAGAGANTGRSASFDGVNDYTTIPAPNYNTNTLTMMAWVKRNGAQPAWAPIIFCRGGNTIAGFGSGDVSGNLRYHWNDAQFDWNSGLTLPDNQWVLVAMVVTPSGTTIHMRTASGMQSATHSVSLAIEEFNGTMTIGADTTASSRRFKGWIDEVRIYKAALAAADVEALYNNGLNGPPQVPETTLAVPEYSPTGTVVGSVAATDPNAGQTLAYSIAGGNVGNRFAIDSASGEITVNGPLALGSIPGYILTIRATDNGSPAMTGEGQVTINLTNVNEAPAFAQDPIDRSALKDTLFSGMIAATDPDPGDTLIYQKLSGPSWLSIASDGSLSGTPLAANLGSNIFTVRVTDSGGLSDEATLDVMVLANAAAVAYWTGSGTSNNWTSANWSGANITEGSVPVFGSGSRNGPINNFTAGTSFGGLQFDAAAAAFTLTGNSINLTGMVSHDGTSLQTVNMPLVLASGSGAISVSAPAGTLRIGGAISGPRGLTKTGAGTLVLSSANSHTGGILVSAGTLSLQAANAPGSGAITNHGTLAFNTTGSTTWAPAITGSGSIQTSNTVTFNGGSIRQDGGLSCAGPTTFANTTASFGGDFKITGGSNLVTIQSGTNLGFAGSSWLATLNTGSRGRLAVTGGSLTIAGAVRDNRDAWFDITQSGGIVAFGGLYANQTESGNGGGTGGNSTYTLTGGQWITGDISGGTSASWSRGIALNLGGGTLTASRSFTINANTINLTGTNGNVTIDTGAFTLGSSYVINGAGGFTKAGSGTLLLSVANNSYAGGTLINAGTVQTSIANALPATGAVTLANAAGATLNLGGHNQTIGALAGGGTNGGDVILGSATLTVNQNASSIFGGAISGSGALVKGGSGSLTLAGSSSHAGSTTVNAGALVVNGAITGNGAVNVAATATLGGSGTISGAVSNSGTLAPGSDGPGNLSISNSLTLAPDSAIAWQVADWTGAAGTGHDKLTVASLDITATAADPVVVRLSQAALVNFTEASTTFTLLQSTAAITGFDPAKFTLDTTGMTSPRGTWAIGMSGNSLVLSYTLGNHPPAFGSNPITVAATEDQPLTGTLTATDPDSGDTITFSKVNGPAWLTVAPNGTLGGTPANADVGLNVFTVQATDNLNDSSTATLHITVANVNDSPVWTADPLNLTGIENLAFTGQISATDDDAGDTLGYSKVNGPSWLSVSSTGALTGTPGPGTSGINTFTVRVSDGSVTVDATVNVTVAPRPTWINPAGGSWPAAGNWLIGAIGSGTGIVADFSTLNPVANATVTLDGARTIGGLMFADTTPSHNWTLATGSGGPLTLATTAGAPTINVANQETTVSAVLAGAQGLVKTGDGTLVLSGANTFTGGLVIQAGTVRAGSASNLASGAVTIETSGTLNTTAAITLSSAISGQGALSHSSGNLVLSGNNPFSGSATITGGFLVFTGLNAENGAPAVALNGGNLALGGVFAGNTATIGSLSGTSAASSINPNYESTTGTKALSVNQMVDGTYAGRIETGTNNRRIALIKTGGATLTLGGANTYTGTTTISEGTLMVNGSLGAGATTVAAGAGLGGTGTLAGAVTNQGTVIPGHNAVGTLTVNNALTLAPGSAIVWEVSDWNGAPGTGYDSLNISSLNLTATGVSPVTVTLSQTALANFANESKTFTLVQTTGGITGFDAAKFVVNTAGFTAGTGTWSVQQSGNSLLLAYTRSNTAPGFASSTITGADATAGDAYASTLAGSAGDPDPGDTVSYSKVSGPEWLVVQGDGALGGTPLGTHAGANSFTVRATDAQGLFSEAALQIQVIQTNPDANGNGMIDAWETVRFGNAAPGANPPDADPDGDGLENLLEYAFDTHPLQPNPSPVNAAMASDGADRFLTLTIPKNPLATNLTFAAEACDDPVAGSWTAASTVVVSDTASQLIIRDQVPERSANRRFMRVKVQTTPAAP